jgi:hypothetical protein
MSPASIESTGMSDLAIFSILLASSAGAVVAAIGIAAVLRLDRLANLLSPRMGAPFSRVGAAFLMGLAGLTVLLGLVPVEDLSRGWTAALAGLSILATLVLVSTAAAYRTSSAASEPRAEAAGPDRMAA